MFLWRKSLLVQGRLAVITNLPHARTIHASRPLDRIVPFLLADIGEGITEVEVLEWHVQEGTPVRQFDRIAEVQSDKATVEITSRYDGVIRKLHYAKGATARVGQPLIDIEVEGGDESGDTGTEETASGNAIKGAAPTASGRQSTETNVPGRDHKLTISAADTLSSSRVKAMPGVRHLAKSRGIDIASVRGTGAQGQVTHEDVLKHSGELATKLAPGSKSPSAVPRQNQQQTELIPLSAFQKAMVKSMQASLTIPHFGYNDEFAVDQILSLRSSLLAAVERDYGIRLTPMAFYLKALSITLTEHPQLNAHYESESGAVRRYTSHNICLAVDTDHGLSVPVLRDVQTLSIIEVAREANRLAEAARANRLPSTDLTGGTITVSNIGSVGGTTASPVILSPQVSIVALGKAQRLPRFDEHQQIVGRTIMPISWSADHRIVDGATLARFTQRWKELVEKPASILLLHLTQP